MEFFSRKPQLNLEKTSSKVLPCEICEAFLNSFLLENLLVNDSACSENPVCRALGIVFFWFWDTALVFDKKNFAL